MQLLQIWVDIPAKELLVAPSWGEVICLMCETIHCYYHPPLITPQPAWSVKLLCSHYEVVFHTHFITSPKIERTTAGETSYQIQNGHPIYQRGYVAYHPPGV